MDKQLTVLITRPQPGADAFAAMLADLQTVISPIMAIEAVEADLGAPEVVIVTSRHAIPAVGALDESPICYCVGAATAEKARGAGLKAIMAGETAKAVAARIVADKPEGPILYPRGRHVAFDMVGSLQEAGLTVRDAVVYDQVRLGLSSEALDLLHSGAGVVVPLFSVRSAALFFEACPDAARLRVVAMSSQIAQIVPERHADQLTIVPNPEAPAMAQAVRNAAFFVKRLEQGQ